MNGSLALTPSDLLCSCCPTPQGTVLPHHPLTLYSIPTHVSPPLSHISSCVFTCVQMSSRMYPHTCVTCPHVSVSACPHTCHSCPHVPSHMCHMHLYASSHMCHNKPCNISTAATRVLACHPVSLPPYLHQCLQICNLRCPPVHSAPPTWLDPLGSATSDQPCRTASIRSAPRTSPFQICPLARPPRPGHPRSALSD
jgi:hypothetical protein